MVVLMFLKKAPLFEINVINSRILAFISDYQFLDKNCFMRFFLTLIVTIFFVSSSFAADGYNIQIKIKEFEKDTLFLGYHYGDKQFLIDTTFRDDNGWFTFSGEEDLKCGMYLVVMPPDNEFFEILIDEANQNFKLETNVTEPTIGVTVTGSEDNKLFFDYMEFISTMRPKADKLKNEWNKAGGEQNQEAKKKYQAGMEKLTNEVKARQDKIFNERPNSLPALILKANEQPQLPEFDGSDEEKQLQQWRWMLEHYFDNIDLKNDCLVRTSFFYQKVNYYLEKLTVQHPDSLIKSIDFILAKMKKNEKEGGENFKYYLVHYFNKYAKSKVVGMDAIYVHLALNYYDKGLAPWTPDTTLQKIVRNAKEAEPTLIGKIAPNITLQDKEGKKWTLHDIESPFIIVYIWDPDCGHCKKAAPDVVKFYNDFKAKGVKMVSICSKFTDDVPKCWETVEERKFLDFLNLVDPYHRSKYKTKYNVKSTPQTFILDKDKTIIMKKIGADQLGDVMDQIILDEQKRLEGK